MRECGRQHPRSTANIGLNLGGSPPHPPHGSGPLVSNPTTPWAACSPDQTVDASKPSSSLQNHRRSPPRGWISGESLQIESPRCPSPPAPYLHAEQKTRRFRFLRTEEQGSEEELQVNAISIWTRTPLIHETDSLACSGKLRKKWLMELWPSNHLPGTVRRFPSTSKLFSVQLENVQLEQDLLSPFFFLWHGGHTSTRWLSVLVNLGEGMRYLWSPWEKYWPQLQYCDVQCLNCLAHSLEPFLGRDYVFHRTLLGSCTDHDLISPVLTPCFPCLEHLHHKPQPQSCHCLVKPLPAVNHYDLVKNMNTSSGCQEPITCLIYYVQK